MYVEIAALASGACLLVLAAGLAVAARTIAAAAPLRDAAIAQAIVGVGLLIRCWAPDSSYRLPLVAATIAYGAHAFWFLTALRRLRGWPPARRVSGSVLLLIGLCAATGLVWPAAAYPALGVAYLLMAALYVACLVPAWRAAEPGTRLPLAIVGACGALCALMYLAWGAAMVVAPAAVVAQGSGPALAGSFLFGLWLNLVANSGYLLLLLRRMLAEIEGQAMLDPLTGASNRRGLDRYLARAGDGGAAQARGLVAIDLDHFKRVNDRHGHAAGDDVLVACAARLRTQLRSTDLLARLGGEEFLVVLADADGRLLGAVAERLRAAVAGAPVVLPDGTALEVTVSIGTALTAGRSVHDGDLARADAALYQAKREGRNRVVRAAAGVVAAA